VSAPFDMGEILLGDTREVLRTLPDSSVQTCVTSPPYFGLRNYDVEGQMGLEKTPDEFVAALVEVFREVRRVLRDDGTLWLNIGDSYARDSVVRWDNTFARENGWSDGRSMRDAPNLVRNAGLKPKDLVGIPWLLAFALRADGWYLRQEIIWHKPNPMPESVRDRCTKAHEQIFLLSKSKQYYFDSEAIEEPAAPSSLARLSQNVHEQRGSDRVPGKTNGAMKAVGGASRNKRSVWSVTTKPTKVKHFATFPPDLIEPCILAGARSAGTVLDPFIGTGTTALVAQAHARRGSACELNPNTSTSRAGASPIARHRPTHFLARRLAGGYWRHDLMPGVGHNGGPAFDSLEQMVLATADAVRPPSGSVSARRPSAIT
jgi:DNA modification methylase